MASPKGARPFPLVREPFNKLKAAPHYKSRASGNGLHWLIFVLWRASSRLYAGKNALSWSWYGARVSIMTSENTIILSEVKNLYRG